MSKTVIKRDGEIQPFLPEKIERWAKYAARNNVSWDHIFQNTIERLPNVVSTEEIHKTMINVCLWEEDINYSRVAARLLYAELRKNMQQVGVSDKMSFKEQFDVYSALGLWTAFEYLPKMEEEYKALYNNYLEYWQIRQWMDKYSLMVDGKPVETPHAAALAIGYSIHGDKPEAFLLAKAVIEGKINLPTPTLNGCRNGDWDTISCSVIEAGDNIPSIGAANHLAYRMTAKKAGIGIRFKTRSKGDDVKGGATKHLGKIPIYHAVDKNVKMFTQISRGGSATVTFDVYDPEIMDLLKVKSQRTPENVRIDKLDYSMAYDNAFLYAVIRDDVYQTVSENGNLGPKLSAREVLKLFLTIREETGRLYCVNLDTMNEHTPFLERIQLSNLCQPSFAKVLTPEGIRELGEVDVGSTIWSGKEWTKITKKWCNGDKEVFKYKTSHGVFVGTEDHRVYENGVKKPVSEIEYGIDVCDAPNEPKVVEDVLRFKEQECIVTQTQNVVGKLESKCSLGVHKVYDITVDCEEHTYWTGGCLVSNCQEICLVTKPYKGMEDLYSDVSEGEMAFCSLLAIVAGKVSREEYPQICSVSVRTLNRLIDKAPMFAESLVNNLRSRRSLGIGIAGLAEYLLNNNASYSDTDVIEELAERHYYYLLKASQDNVTEFGEVSGVDLNWLPIDTKKTSREPTLDWEELRGKPRANSVLVAHMPTESSSLFSNTPNGLYPVRVKCITKKSRKGTVQYISPDVTELAWDIPNKTLSKMYGAVQAYTDQGISCDYYKPTLKAKMSDRIEEWIEHNLNGNKSMYYLNFKDNNSGSFQEEDPCNGGCKI